MKPLSERDENFMSKSYAVSKLLAVGMKPLSERDENKKRACYLPFL